MSPVKIYLDTSIPNFALSAKKEPMVKATQELVKGVKKGKYIPFISSTVIDEIKDTTDIKRRDDLLKKVDEISPQVLEVLPEVRNLAGRYVKNKIIPKKYHADAVHLAVATYHKIPIVVSWNFKHMVRPETRRGVNEVNKKLGYPQIDIVSPFELVGV